MIIPSLALCVALYTFLSNNPKFREFSPKFWATVMLQLIAIVCCSFALLFNMSENYLYPNFSIDFVHQLTSFFLLLFAVFFISSWLYLCRIFYIIYGSLYHMRKRRFLKYTKLFGWFYEKFLHKSFYETNYRKRTNFKNNCFANISDKDFKKLKNGGTILLLYEDKYDYSELIQDYIIGTIDSQETIDYVSTYKTPIELCKKLDKKKPDPETFKIITKRLSIIDCFAPHYAFDDKVIKYEKEVYSEKGYKFFEAESFADIHTAANNSWYRFRKLCKDEENNQYRIPHRTIYDTLSSLIRFSSEEQYFLFLRHVIYSEKSYGMISLIIEPKTLKNELKNDLIRMADIIIEVS